MQFDKICGMSRLRLFSLFVLGLPVLAHSNDGGLVSGGTPRLLKGHATVSMQSEVIDIHVLKDKVRVECNFVFHNSGPATRVRMGFPDFAYGAMDPGEEEKFNVKAPGAIAGMTWFRSWVNGRAVPTKLESGSQEGEYWRTKTVSFKARGNTRVRDVYEQPVSAGIIGTGAGSIHSIQYVLHTGASWHGPIGRTVVHVLFDDPAVPPPFKVEVTDSARSAFSLDWSKLSRSTIYYNAPAVPTVKGRLLTFERNHWRPGKDDDITLYFRFGTYKGM
jgi:hypothetical protein